MVFHRDTLPAEVIETKLRQAYIKFYNPLRRWDRVLRNVPGLKFKELWGVWRAMRNQRKVEVLEPDPVSNYLSLAPESREDWLALQASMRGVG